MKNILYQGMVLSTKYGVLTVSYIGHLNLNHYSLYIKIVMIIVAIAMFVGKDYFYVQGLLWREGEKKENVILKYRNGLLAFPLKLHI